MNLDEHPTVRRVRAAQAARADASPLDAEWLRQLARECGADDVGLVELARPGLDTQRDEILRNYPWTKSLVSFVTRMAREPLRAPPRSVANLEFHRSGESANHTAAAIVHALEARGIRAVNPSIGFPMEMAQSPGFAIWVVSHKPVAVEAGLGHMGIHRNLIHPTFGNFVVLGTVLIDREATAYDHPIEYNPCLECKLCVAACPVGAIGPEGTFNFSSCFTHNYREFLGGFTDWVEQIADSRDAQDYRRRVNEPETASFWQSLSYGPNYKSAYCMAVCPAGEDVIGAYLADRQRHMAEIVRPLQERAEPVYVVPGSDAEAIARRKFKNKTVKPVGNSQRPRTIQGLLNVMRFAFQPNQSQGLDAVFHFTFTGSEERQATVTIRNRTFDLRDGLVGAANVSITADAKTWLGYLAKEKSLPLALLSRKVRISGNPRLLLAFGKCFPSAGVRRRTVEILPQPSRMRSEPARYQKNDPATAKIRWRGQLVLAAVERATHNVKTFRFRAPDGGAVPFDYLPGQFLTIFGPAKRSYTIASTPTWRDRVEITVKREAEGVMSRWLHDECKVGDIVEIEAPSGTFVFTGDGPTGIALIGGGVGITPLMSVARYLTDTEWPGRIDLVLGFRTPDDVIFREELTALASRNANLRFSVVHRRIDAALLLSAVPDIVARRAHICGPPGMMDAVQVALRDLGVPESQVKTEAFGTIKRDPRAKGTASAPVAGHVLFQSSDTRAPVPADATILDAADDVGVFIDNACRSGTCESCRVKLIAGDVTPPVGADGYILACQAHVQGDVVVDA